MSLTNIEPIIAIDTTDIRGSSKRIVDSIGLNKGGEGIYKLEKAQRINRYIDISLYGYS